ncbi:aspartyl protease family protein 2 [Selaginella moellendorffii]|nr:aspartyl protease family protein 2 [Selaginella moellendorffii]|eukprot:XP_002965292.2 aspartyl protease family protein 2 [Selaginella moellendorffii]
MALAALVCILSLVVTSVESRASSSDKEYLKISIDALFLGRNPTPVTPARGSSSSSTQGLEEKEESVSSGLQIGLMHRDSADSPYRPANATVHGLVRNRLHRDELRLLSISSRISLGVAGIPKSSLTNPLKNTNPFLQQDFETPLRSGLSDGSGEYFVSLGVGTPPRTVNMVADTGSDVLWLQCLPCQSCYGQTDPLFNPSFSSTFQSITCGSSLCQQLLIRGCRRNQCLYQVSYGDGSFTVGEFSTETLSFGSNAVNSVAIGCGHNNQGLFTGAAGLLGLGKGLLSFPSQVGQLYGSVFSYCLPTRESTGSVPLIFGNQAVASNAQFTTLLTNPKLDTFYYVEMVGIKVGGTSVNIPAGSLSLDSSTGNGGVILDSGTAVTRLVTSAYNPMRDAFRAGMPSDAKMTSGFSLFDTCYDLSGRSSIMLPAVSFVFNGGATMALPAQNIMVPVDNSGTYCLAFAPNSENFSIIGNIQQQSFRMSFDSTGNRVGIGANQCN